MIKLSKRSMASNHQRHKLLTDWELSNTNFASRKRRKSSIENKEKFKKKKQNNRVNRLFLKLDHSEFENKIINKLIIPHYCDALLDFLDRKPRWQTTNTWRNEEAKKSGTTFWRIQATAAMTTTHAKHRKMTNIFW